MFYSQKSYSLTETLVDLIPEEMMSGMGAIPIINAVMNTQVWQFLFPDLAKYSKPQRLDFRCGFNKDYLQSGRLSNSKLSQVFLKEGN